MMIPDRSAMLNGPRKGLPASDVAPLFQPGRIGSLTLPNRIVMPPMTTRGADAEGFVTSDTLAYYRARARGGVGLITVEMASPEKVGRHRFRELGIYDDCFLPGLTELVREIHAFDSKASIQLGHGGGHTRRDVCGETPIAPSAIPHPVFEGTMEIVVPEEMSAARIEQTIEAFVFAAERASRAGFDAVEVHAAHGYLISQFMCPAENRRTDRYGGSLANRARFGLEIVRRIRARVPDIALIFRMSAHDYFPGGMPFAEGKQLAIWAEEAGAHAIHVSGGHYRSLPSAAVMIPPMAMGPTPFIDYAAEIRRSVGVPVIVVGAFGDPKVAAGAISDGVADFVALGRPLVADPDWVQNTRRGIPVRSCLRCNTCVDAMRAGNRLGCLVNPKAGSEVVYETAEGGPRDEKIAVIGAGPAGLSYASLVAGHNEVTVFEKAEEAGGAFLYAGHAPLFQGVEAAPASFQKYVGSLKEVCRMNGVKFCYGVDVLANHVDFKAYDRVVIATGASYPPGLGRLILRLLRTSLLHRWPLGWLAKNDAVREWFYRRARKATGPSLQKRLCLPAQVEVIGDARVAGKSAEAIKQAFDAALRPRPDGRRSLRA